MTQRRKSEDPLEGRIMTKVIKFGKTMDRVDGVRHSLEENINFVVFIANIFGTIRVISIFEKAIVGS